MYIIVIIIIVIVIIAVIVAMVKTRNVTLHFGYYIIYNTSHFLFSSNPQMFLTGIFFVCLEVNTFLKCYKHAFKYCYQNALQVHYILKSF